MALTQITTNGIKDGTITGTDLATNVDLADNQKIRLGTGNDLEIYHNATNSVIADVGNGNLSLQTNGAEINFWNPTDSEYLARFSNGAYVKLFYDGSTKFETTSNGINVTGRLLATGSSGYGLILNDDVKISLGSNNDLQIYHDGSHSYIKDTGTGRLILQSSQLCLQSTTGENFLVGNPDAGTELYHDNSKKFETASDGILASGAIRTNAATSGAASANQATFDFNGQNARLLSYHGSGGSISAFTNPSGGSLAERFRIDANGNIQIPADNKYLQIGAGADLNFHHDGSHSYISNSTGTLHIMGKAGENSIQAQPDGAVELYYDNVKQVQTTANGVGFVNNCTFSDSKKIQMGNGNDLLIYHDGTSNIITSVNGNLFIQAASGENGITVNQNGAVELYHDNSKKFETTSGGVSVTGNLDCDGIRMLDSAEIRLGTGDDLKIYHDGSHSYIADRGTGNLSINSSNGEIQLAFNDFAGTFEHMVRCVVNNQVELYYNGSKKFETTSTGGTVTGRLLTDGVSMGDSEELLIGAGNDFKLRHDGTDNHIVSSNGDINIQVADTENAIIAKPNGAVELYYDNTKKFETTSTGTTITGQVKADVDSNLNSATGYNGQLFGLLVSYDGGSSPNDEGNGICFAQKYFTGDAATIRTGAIIGYKSIGNGSFGGGLQFKVQQSGATPLKVALKMDHEGHLYMPNDNQSLKIGASQDLVLKHDGTHSYIENATGGLYIKVGNGEFLSRNGTEVLGKFLENGAVELYYDNSKKFETISTGARIQHTTNLGSTAGNASDILQLHQSDASNTTTYDFMNYRFANGSTHATSEMRFRRHVDITDQGYWGLRDGACTAGYGNQENFRIDRFGRATAPYQVGFTAYSTSNSFSLASGGKVPFNAIGTGFGSFTNRTTYGATNFYSTSNARFTAPVAGLYLFIVCIYFHSTNNNTLCTIVPRKNGNEMTNGNNTIFFMSANGHSEGHTPNGSLLLQLDANDYIEVYRRVNQSGTNSCYGSHSHFQGFLVG